MESVVRKKNCALQTTHQDNRCFMRINGVPMSDGQVYQELQNALSAKQSFLYAAILKAALARTRSASNALTRADDTMCVHQDDRATLLINGAVTEVFVSQDDAKNVRLTMERIQGLPGILTCGPERTCVITDGNSERVCYALTMTPSCTTLTMSTARPHHFAQYARILANVAQERQLNHNFISLDCLCVDPAGNCFISDWGSATKINTPLPSGSGKRYFVPCCRMSGTGHGKRRLSSLRLDLESLYLVAISCSLKRVPWTRPYAPSVRCECERWCALGRGSFNNCTMPKGEWDYLADLSDALFNAPNDDGCTSQDITNILEAFYYSRMDPD